MANKRIETELAQLFEEIRETTSKARGLRLKSQILRLIGELDERERYSYRQELHQALKRLVERGLQFKSSGKKTRERRTSEISVMNKKSKLNHATAKFVQGGSTGLKK